MSKQQVRLASLLLEEAFGGLVETVGTHLLKHGASNLGEIAKGTGLKMNQVTFHHPLWCDYGTLAAGEKMFSCVDSAPSGTL